MGLFANSTSPVFGGNSTATTHNPMKDFEVASAPEDSISCLKFSPDVLPQDFLIAGSWDNNVSCWEVQANGQTVPKAQQSHQGPVLDVAWSDDATKVLSASCDKTVKMWDLNSNQSIQVAQHDAPVKSVHWIAAPKYTCIMSTSWDKTIKFWDTRTPNPILTLDLPERSYCADVCYPLAVVATAGLGLIVYQLQEQPKEFKRFNSLFKFQHCCLSIFRNAKNFPTGFALGNVEGRVAIHYFNPKKSKSSFSFKCHRSNDANNGYQDVYAVNDVSFHPVHSTLATVGSDGRFIFWDKNARTQLKESEQMEQSITCCCFNARGDIFAYAVSYDWSKGHEYNNLQMKNSIFLRPCYDEMKLRNKL